MHAVVVFLADKKQKTVSPIGGKNRQPTGEDVEEDGEAVAIQEPSHRNVKRSTTSAE